MKTTLIFLSFAVPIICFGRNWVELKADNGTVGQVRVDFDLYDLKVQESGYSFSARGEQNGRAIGFKLVVSDNWKTVTTLVQGAKNLELLEQRTEVEVRNIGISTQNLDEELNKILSYTPERKNDRFCCGLFNVTAPVGYSEKSSICIFDFVGVGIVLDSENNRIPGSNFLTRMIIDLPANKLIVYYALEGGYGGRSSETKIREEWKRRVGQPVAGGDATR